MRRRDPDPESSVGEQYEEEEFPQISKLRFICRGIADQISERHCAARILGGDDYYSAVEKLGRSAKQKRIERTLPRSFGTVYDVSFAGEYLVPLIGLHEVGAEILSFLFSRGLAEGNGLEEFSLLAGGCGYHLVALPPENRLLDPSSTPPISFSLWLIFRLLSDVPRFEEGRRSAREFFT